VGAAYLAQAEGAMARGDLLRAIQMGLYAARDRKSSGATKCDAYLLLALASLELEAPAEALAFAVGAHLSACRCRDPVRTERATAVLHTVAALCPLLGAPSVALAGTH
jgi:hypothetical protein